MKTIEPPVGEPDGFKADWLYLVNKRRLFKRATVLGYQSMNTTKICVHHSGPLSPTDPYSSSKFLSEQSIDRAHEDRGFNKSTLGFYIGYNVVIYPDGTMKQYRLLGEQTAAATGSNFDTFHICLIGNFTKNQYPKFLYDYVDRPSEAQITTLKNLMASLLDNYPQKSGLRVLPGNDYSFSVYNIYPHRILQPNHTSCYGNLLDDNWARNIGFDYMKEKYKSSPVIFKVISALSDFFSKAKLGMRDLGSQNWDSDEGTNYKLYI